MHSASVHAKYSVFHLPTLGFRPSFARSCIFQIFFILCMSVIFSSCKFSPPPDVPPILLNDWGLVCGISFLTSVSNGGKCSRTSAAAWSGHRRRYILCTQGLFRHLEDDISPSLSLSVSASPANPTTSYRTVDVQFPVANEASALTRKYQILFASLSVDARPGRVASSPRIRPRNAHYTTRPYRRLTTSARSLSVASRFAPRFFANHDINRTSHAP